MVVYTIVALATLHLFSGGCGDRLEGWREAVTCRLKAVRDCVHHCSLVHLFSSGSGDRCGWGGFPQVVAVHDCVHHCSLGHPPPVLWGLW